jgi:hypothetical protein
VGGGRRESVPESLADAGIPYYWIIDIEPPASLLAGHLAGAFEYADGGPVHGTFVTTAPLPVEIELDALLRAAPIAVPAQPRRAGSRRSTSSQARRCSSSSVSPGRCGRRARAPVPVSPVDPGGAPVQPKLTRASGRPGRRS